MLFNMSVDFKLNNSILRPFAFSVVRKLLPKGKIQGHEYVALNPTRHDRNLGSFRINLITLKWADFATNDKGGDLVSLWSYICKTSPEEAEKELLKIIGRNQ